MSLRRKRKNRRFDRRHVLDVKLRASHRRQARVRRLALVLIFFAATFMGGYGAWRGGHFLFEHFITTNPAFAIHRLDIQTDGSIAPEQLRRWSGVRLEENLFALNLDRVKRDLELVPAIAGAAVERSLPHTLRIRVTEREPVGQVTFARSLEEGEGQRYLLDLQGFVMFPLEESQLAEPASAPRPLPVIQGIPSGELRPGRRLTAEQTQAALQLIAAFGRSSMVGITHLKQIDLRTPGLLQVTVSDDCTVTFGLADFDTQLRRWRLVHDHGRRLGRQLLTLDLSVSNNLPARWQEAQNPPATRTRTSESIPRRNNV